MRTTIVITDLTRMSVDRVCIAGIDKTNYQSIRPILEYGVHGISQRNLFLESNIVIHPKVKISFNSQKVRIDPPHIGDLEFDPRSVTYGGLINENDWETLLLGSSVNSVQDIFAGHLKEYHGYIVEPGTNTRSLGTVSQIEIENMNFELTGSGRIKARLNFIDKKGYEYKNVPINDLTFLTLAESKLSEMHSLESVNHHINNLLENKKRIYLRLGLARPWHMTEEYDHCWMQVTGIYTFPDYLKGKSFVDF